eukprot:COSAG01_NODE_59672_length_299_cov_0.610000_1_plen_65_part_10
MEHAGVAGGGGWLHQGFAHSTECALGCTYSTADRIHYSRKTTSDPLEKRSATDFVKFVHSVSFYP